jgi:hypothetical protein
MPLRRVSVPLLAALGGIAFAGTAPADAYVLKGTPWAAQTITYHVSSKGYSKPVDRAARAWNHAHIGIQLRKGTAATADVTVSYGGRACEGEAVVGMARRGPGSWVKLGSGCNKRVVSLQATHEFGHVLGLEHETDRCARMNTTLDRSGTPNRCHEHAIGYWLKHPLSRDDIRGARAIYGG